MNKNGGHKLRSGCMNINPNRQSSLALETGKRHIDTLRVSLLRLTSSKLITRSDEWENAGSYDQIHREDHMVSGNDCWQSLPDDALSWSDASSVDRRHCENHRCVFETSLCPVLSLRLNLRLFCSSVKCELLRRFHRYLDR